MKMIYIIALTSIAFTCNNANKTGLNMSIEDFDVCQRTFKDQIDGKVLLFRWKCFVISNYSATTDNISLITKKACSELDSNYLDYFDYTIYFFNKSKFTTDSMFINHRNEFELKCMPGEILYSYSWVYGKPNFIHHYTNDNLIEILEFKCE